MSVSEECDVHVDGRHTLPEDGQSRGVEVGHEEATAEVGRQQQQSTKQGAPEASRIVEVAKWLRGLGWLSAERLGKE